MDTKVEFDVGCRKWQTGLIFTKLSLKQTGQCRHHGISIGSLSADNHFTAIGRRQRQNIQDTLAVHSNSILYNPHIRIKLRRHPYDLCSRPGVQPFFVRNNELSFQNAVPSP
jgi:hypothetical protein